MSTFSAYINPLRCFQIEGLSGQSVPEPKFGELAKYLVSEGHDCSMDAVTKRYKEIIDPAKILFVAPADAPYILEKLFWPLRHAISAYMLSNYLGVIAQCGYVSEMVAILWLEMGNFQINNRPMNTEKVKQLYGRTFEKMGQEERVRILDAYELIKIEDRTNFDRIRTLRRKYLHLLTHSHERINTDAIAIFLATAELVKSVLGISLNQGRVAFSPLFEQWMARNSPDVSAQQGNEL